MSNGQIPIEVERVEFYIEYRDVIISNSEQRTFRVWAKDREIDKKLKSFAINSGAPFYLNDFICYSRSDSSRENEKRQEAIINQFKTWLKESFLRSISNEKLSVDKE